MCIASFIAIAFGGCAHSVGLPYSNAVDINADDDFSRLLNSGSITHFDEVQQSDGRFAVFVYKPSEGHFYRIAEPMTKGLESRMLEHLTFGACVLNSASSRRFMDNVDRAERRVEKH